MSDLVQDLRETAQAFNSTAWRRRDGGQEWSIASIKLENAADRIEALEAVVKAARIISDTFERDEAQGYRSRDRQFAIDMLKPYLAALTPPSHTSNEE